MPMNVGEAIVPAINHTKRVLFRPFAIRKWLALGFASMLAFGGGGGSFNVNLPSSGDAPSEEMIHWVVTHMPLIVAGTVLLFAVGLALSWLASVFKFVYINQLTRDPRAIREPFGRFMGLGTSYFLWTLAFGLTILVAVAVLVGAPLLAAFVGFRGQFGAAHVLAIIWAVIAVIVIVIAAGVIDVFAGDFVTAAMFVRSVRVVDGWRTVLPIIRANAGQSVLYVLMLIAIGIVTAIGSIIVMIAVLIAFLIPGGVLALIGWAIHSAGGWSPLMIGYCAIMGLVLLLAFGYVMSCAMQPFVVFRRTFALVVLGQADASLATVPETPPQGQTDID